MATSEAQPARELTAAVDDATVERLRRRGRVVAAALFVLAVASVLVGVSGAVLGVLGAALGLATALTGACQGALALHWWRVMAPTPH
jgi:hypothetical protein